MANHHTHQRSIKLISLNIERERHLARVIPFIKLENPDVVCLQESFWNDLPRLEHELGMHSHFAPMTLFPRGTAEAEPEIEGLAILSKRPLHGVRKDYYVTGGRAPGDLVPFNKSSDATTQRVLLSGIIKTNAGAFRIATTHFTWSPNGQTGSLQRRDIVPLQEILADFEDIVFCGDFNAPRGKEIFNQLASRYTDWIPRETTTTLDQNIHRVKDLQLVVDGLFSSDHYRVSDARVVSGVSDHCALVGTIHLAPSRVTTALAT